MTVASLSQLSHVNHFLLVVFQTSTTGTMGKGVGGATSSLTSQQQHVVASYIQQKTKAATGGGGTSSFFTKRPVANPQQYYCEVCKISCACAAVSKLVGSYC